MDRMSGCLLGQPRILLIRRTLSITSVLEYRTFVAFARFNDLRFHLP